MRERIESVDLFRLIAMFGVVILHTAPFHADIAPASSLYRYLDLLCDQLPRFAVPFFFVISGYFWGVKLKQGAPLLSTSFVMGKRIGMILLAWSLIYLLPFNYHAMPSELGFMEMIGWNIHYLLAHPMQLLMEGTKIHLWFLVSLLYALLLSTLLLHYHKRHWLLGVGVGLYLFALLAKAYLKTPIGIEFAFDTRNGPFFSTLFFVTGYLLAQRQRAKRWLWYGVALSLIGTLLQGVEIVTLWKLFGTNPKQDFVMSTYLIGVGVAMIALSNHPRLRIQRVSHLGKMVLGVYAIHFIFVELLLPIDQLNDSILWELSYTLLVFLLAVGSTWLLSKSHLTAWLVR